MKIKKKLKLLKIWATLFSRKYNKNLDIWERVVLGFESDIVDLNDHLQQLDDERSILDKKVSDLESLVRRRGVVPDNNKPRQDRRKH